MSGRSEQNQGTLDLIIIKAVVKSQYVKSERK